MSADRAASLRLLEGTSALPATMRARYWDHLSDDALTVLARVQVDTSGRRAQLASPSDAERRLLALLREPSQPLLALDVNDLLGSVRELREAYAGSESMRCVLDQIVGAAAQHELGRAEVSSRQRARASKPRKANQDRAEPYTRIALEIVGSDRYKADSEKATRERQSAAFERRVIAEKLDPISASTRRRRMKDARKILAGQ